MAIYRAFVLFTLYIIFWNGILAQAETGWPVQSNGLQSKIQWDHYSLIIDGQRPFIFSGEMHPFRLPVPELWRDILEKMKAMGMRAVSVYIHWGFHSQYANVTDFESGAHDIERLFETARDVGILVIVRPGPYINAETSGGGLALWATNGRYGTIRANGTAWTSAWESYWNAITQLTAKYQLTNNGNGTALSIQIENEFPNQWKDVHNKVPNPVPINYMELLEAKALANGITIPMTHNMPSVNGKSWSKDYDTVGAGGDVDLYGLDSYPSCWSCIPSDCSTSNPSFTLLNYWDHFQVVSPNQPPMSPEFQGGALNPWYGPKGGCESKTNEKFVNFYYRDNIAQRMTILNLYMTYGGTNWGWLAAPFLGSSYDYSAAISEDRNIGNKFYEIKNFGLFTRVANEMSLCDRVGNDTSYTTNEAIFSTVLLNPETNARFYVIRHADPQSNTTEPFLLKVETSIGNFTVPQNQGSIEIDGNESKILVADFHAGPNTTLIYSTAEILSYTLIDEWTLIALWVPTGLGGEFFLKDAKVGSLGSCDGCSNVTFRSQNEGIVVNFKQGVGRTVLTFDNAVRVVLLDRTFSYKTFVPGLNDDPFVPVNTTAIVVGPRLVRSAQLNHHSRSISILGDYNSNTSIEVFTREGYNQIVWNGMALATRATAWGSLEATIPNASSFKAPTISAWKVKDSLPEIGSNYSDFGPAWVIANATSTKTGTSGTKPYLFADEYGFYTGIRLWRGTFGGDASGVYLNVQGGNAFSWSAYLNGHLIGSYLGLAVSSVAALDLSFSNATVSATGNNTLLVIHDDSGHEEGSAVIHPRGILNATLHGSYFTEWKVTGTAGGSTKSQLDKVRTHYNEGGLTGERLGWHLPGFSDGNWMTGSPEIGFTGSGVRFYRGQMPLQVCDGIDVGMAFRFTTTGITSAYKAFLYVNGYQFGRFYPYISSSTDFPVPPGILNYNGNNTIAIALWAQSEAGAGVQVLPLITYSVGSSLDTKFDGEYLRPVWEDIRNRYE